MTPGVCCCLPLSLSLFFSFHTIHIALSTLFYQTNREGEDEQQGWVCVSASHLPRLPTYTVHNQSSPYNHTPSPTFHTHSPTLAMNFLRSLTFHRPVDILEFLRYLIAHHTRNPNNVELPSKMSDNRFFFLI